MKHRNAASQLENRSIFCKSLVTRTVSRGTEFAYTFPRGFPKPFGIGDWQLYDLSTDPAELVDLSQQRPKLRVELIEIWNRYAEETGVILPPGGSLSF